MRKQNIAIILAVLFAVAFISGIIVSTYEIFPHPILKFIEHAFTNDTDVLYYQNDVNSLIHINNESSITKTRNDLIKFIFNQPCSYPGPWSINKLLPVASAIALTRPNSDPATRISPLRNLPP